jgi:hypothetical protein
MSDLKKAAQQALEALEFMADQWGFTPKANRPERWQAIEALRAALAQQQEQEPVEIKPPNPEGATQCIVRWLAETPAGWVGAWDREALERFTAHPPRREWVSLTEEERVKIIEFGSTLADIARAIEQACKERNT